MIRICNHPESKKNKINFYIKVIEQNSLLGDPILSIKSYLPTTKGGKNRNDEVAPIERMSTVEIDQIREDNTGNET